MAAGIAWTLAALPEPEASRLAGLVRASADQRLGLARHAAIAGGWSADDTRLAEREAVAMGVEELASVAALWPATAAEVRRLGAALAGSLPRAAAAPGAGPRDARIPERTAATRGPLGVYYYDHLAAVLGDGRTPAALERRSDVLAYEALNLIDGKRTVGEIRDLLSGRYAPVPLAEVTEWIDLLVRAGVVRVRTR